MYIISWFWSDDKTFWIDRVQTKLPFLLLPLAFGLLPSFSAKQRQAYTIGLCLLILSGIAYSMSFLFTAAHQYIAGYAQSHVLPTPAARDHIRFSMTVALSTAWCWYIFPELRGRFTKLLVGLSTIIFLLYLHILAAKTGLIASYVLVLMFAIYQLTRRSKIVGLSVLLLLFVGAMVSVRYIPTLKHRLGYTIYSYQQYTQGNTSGDYSDIGRVISYELALQIIKEHPVMGVGAGDIMSAMSALYDQRYPHIPPAQRLVPHNQFLTIGVATGLLSVAFFLWWFCAPLATLKRDRSSFFFCTVWVMLLFFLMTDASLEVQFGVFVFLYFLLWQKHTLLPEPSEKRQLHE